MLVESLVVDGLASASSHLKIISYNYEMLRCFSRGICLAAASLRTCRLSANGEFGSAYCSKISCFVMSVLLRKQPVYTLKTNIGERRWMLGLSHSQPLSRLASLYAVAQNSPLPYTLSRSPTALSWMGAHVNKFNEWTEDFCWGWGLGFGLGVGLV